MKLIWGFDSSLLQTEFFIFESDIWFGERKSQSNVTYDILKLFKGKLDEFDGLSELSETMPDSFLVFFMKKLDWYMDMFDRTEFGRMSSYPARRDYLILTGHLFYSLLKEKQIEYAFFISPPHFGVDAILADICNFLNINVYYGYQSLFENKFFVLDYRFSLLKPPQNEVLN